MLLLFCLQHTRIPQTPTSALITFLCNKSHANVFIPTRKPLTDKSQRIATGNCCLPVAKPPKKRDIPCCDRCRVIASFLHDGRTDGDVRRDIAGFPRKTWRLRRETAFATSGGWSHHKEDKTKGHSRAMNHMLLSPDPEP